MVKYQELKNLLDIFDKSDAFAEKMPRADCIKVQAQIERLRQRALDIAAHFGTVR